MDALSTLVDYGCFIFAIIIAVIVATLMAIIFFLAMVKFYNMIATKLRLTQLIPALPFFSILKVVFLSAVLSIPHMMLVIHVGGVPDKLPLMEGPTLGDFHFFLVFLCLIATQFVLTTILTRLLLPLNLYQSLIVSSGYAPFFAILCFFGFFGFLMIYIMMLGMFMIFYDLFITGQPRFP
ncbi:MAG: hypothetical protein KDA65_16815 [Planctomycetaceae bacterium]|nr:hypothetical protein [Planctomycetaceae bacterium]